MSISTEANNILTLIADTMGYGDILTADERNIVRDIAVSLAVKDLGLDTEVAFDIFWGEGAYAKMSEKVKTLLEGEINNV